MTFNLILILILLAIWGVLLAWNFYPPLRKFVRGKSTVIETIYVTTVAYLEMIHGVITDLEQQGYIPEGWQVYLPLILASWVVIKRIQTTTPFGRNE